MTLSGTSGSGASSGATSARAADRSDRREPTATSAQSKDDFDRVMNARRSRQDESGDDDSEQRGDTPPDNALAGLAGNPPPLPAALRTAEEAPRTAPRASNLTPSGTQAAMDAALQSNVMPGITEVGATDPAQLWEASVRDPNAVPLDVRVFRAEKTAAETQPAWTVSVRSTGANTDTLARHASRLDERLRKRGVDFAHVRVEGADENAGNEE